MLDQHLHQHVGDIRGVLRVVVLHGQLHDLGILVLLDLDLSLADLVAQPLGGLVQHGLGGHELEVGLDQLQVAVVGQVGGLLERRAHEHGACGGLVDGLLSLAVIVSPGSAQRRPQNQQPRPADCYL